MSRRGKIEIIKDILDILRKNNKVKPTPLLRRANLSTSRFKKYSSELLKKNMIKKIKEDNSTYFYLTEKGREFLKKYRTIINFIDEFEL